MLIAANNFWSAIFSVSYYSTKGISMSIYTNHDWEIDRTGLWSIMLTLLPLYYPSGGMNTPYPPSGGLIRKYLANTTVWCASPASKRLFFLQLFSNQTQITHLDGYYLNLDICGGMAAARSPWRFLFNSSDLGTAASSLALTSFEKNRSSGFERNLY
jgi:hypothetical protein